MRKFLKEGFRLNNGNGKYYIIDKPVGTGSSSIAYSAYSIENGKKNRWIIKEYNPLYADKEQDAQGFIKQPQKSNDEYFDGLKNFKEAINIQIEVRNEGYIDNQTFPIGDQFENNGTYYVVVPEYRGETFSKLNGISLLAKLLICKSISQYILKCHEKGYLCLDIKPENIFVVFGDTVSTMYFDFDSLKRKVEVQNTGIFSYTKRWAAPELKNENRYAEISEKTDIYIVGELLFWSIFGTNSTLNDRKRNSVYDFQNTEYEEFIDDETGKILTEIFRRTIRSNSEYRYNNVSAIIEQIDKAIYHQQKKTQFVVDSNVCKVCKNFTGRNEEVKNIDTIFASGEKNIVILKGPDGIGKRQTARKYAYNKRNYYKSIIELQYSKNLVDTIYNTELTLDFLSRIHDTTIDTCKRKLTLFKAAFMPGDRGLLIIEDFNDQISELDSANAAILEIISSLPCDIIITTSKSQIDYTSVNIGHFEVESLRMIFKSIYDYTLYDQQDVDNLIEYVDYNTVFTTFAANICKYYNISVGTLLTKIKNLNDDLFEKTLRDKPHDYEYILSKLLRSSGIKDDELEFLFRTCLIPTCGIDTHIFKDSFVWYEEEETAYKNLLDASFIEIQDGRITVHPLISRLVLSLYKNNSLKSISDEIDNDILGYFLCRFSCVIDIFCKYLPMGSYEYDTFKGLGKSIMEKLIDNNIVEESSADFIIKYIFCYNSELSKAEKDQLFIFALNNYEDIIEGEKYNRGKEIAYLAYYIHKLRTEESVADTIYEKHYNYVRLHKDKFLKQLWKCEEKYYKILQLYHQTDDYKLSQLIRNSISFGNFALNYVRLACKESKMSNNKPEYGFVISKFHAYSPGVDLTERILKLTSPDIFLKKTLVNSLFRWMSRWLNNQEKYITDEIIYKFKTCSLIDNIDICFLSNIHSSENMVLNRLNLKSLILDISDLVANGYWEEAFDVLNRIIEDANSIRYKSVDFLDIYKVYFSICIRLRKYSSAIIGLERYIDICNKHGLNISAKIYLSLINCYNELGDSAKAAIIIDKMNDISNIDQYDSTIQAELNYNLGQYYLTIDNKSMAKEKLYMALKQYDSVCIKQGPLYVIYYIKSLSERLALYLSKEKYFGKARTLMALSKFHYNTGDFKISLSLAKKAKKIFGKYGGKTNPETEACLATIYLLKKSKHTFHP